jgi:UPF0176 protein
MTSKVAAFYQFAALPDFRELREPLRALCSDLALKGSVLLAHEGINGTVAGQPGAIDEFVAALRHGDLFGGRLDRLELKFSTAAEMPFGRLKIRLKKEIVTFGDTATDPTRQVGTYVEPADWNDLIATPGTVVIDTRNAFEVAHGRFNGAIDWQLSKFSDFPRALAQHRDALQGKTVVSYCTGGIRCEKAALLMAEAGVEHVLQLDGGILKYFEETGGRHFDGDCFVFDARETLNPDLAVARST